VALCASNKGSISTGYENIRIFISAALRKIIGIGELFSSAFVSTVKDVRRER
jgi:hypothetical protein